MNALTKTSLSEVLSELLVDKRFEQVSINDLLVKLGGKASGFLLFLFAVPNLFPMAPGVSGILGLPLIFLAAQLSLGFEPWLPDFISRRSFSREKFHALLKRVIPWLEKIEKILRPRASYLTSASAKHFIGFACLTQSLILALPIPLGNMLPALAICIMALGLIEHDGVWVLIGLAVAIAAMLVVSGVMLLIVSSLSV